MDTRRRASGATQPHPQPTSVEGGERRKRRADDADKQVSVSKRPTSEPESSGRDGLQSSTEKTTGRGSASKPFYTDDLSPATLLPLPHPVPPLRALRPPSVAAAVAAKKAGARFLYLKSNMQERSRAWREFQDKLEKGQCMHAGAVFGDGFIKMNFITNNVAEEVRLYLQKQGIEAFLSLDPPPPTSVPAPPLPLQGTAVSQSAKAKPVGPLPSLPQTPKPKPQTLNPKPQTPRSPGSRPKSPPPPTSPRPTRACNASRTASRLPGAQPDRGTVQAPLATLAAIATKKTKNPTARQDRSSTPSTPIGLGKGKPRPTSGSCAQSKEYRCGHGRRKGLCVECGGGSICAHGRQKHWCKECGGSALCSHGRQKSRCKDCGGSGICAHGRHRYRCTKCNQKAKQ